MWGTRLGLHLQLHDMHQVFYFKVTTNLPAIHISALLYICCACTTYHLYLIWISYANTVQYTLILVWWFIIAGRAWASSTLICYAQSRICHTQVD